MRSRGVRVARAASPRPGARGPLAPAAFLLGVVLAAAACGSDAPADLVLRGGVVRTMDEALPTASAVAARDGRIVYVGDDAGVDAYVGDGTEVVELAGRLVLPGFHDTHVHPASGGVELGDCDLNPAETRTEVLRIVGECVARAPEGAWVRGGGWQLPLFPGGAPPRELLDSLVPGRPAYLSSSDAHSAWVNSRALEIAGVTAVTVDPPPDGVIVRAADGSPQGTLRESAMGLVSRHVPPHTAEEVGAGLARGLAMAASFGITTLHEASADEAFLRAYAAAEQDGSLTARAIVSLRVDPARGTEQVAELVELRERYSGTLVQPRAAKIFLDGVIEGGTAALLDPYVERPDWRGELNVPADALPALVAALDSAGFKVHVHAIGDRAIRVALDAFEARRATDGGAGPRHILAHIQLFDPADVPRFAELGVVASFQPLWAYEDSYIRDLTEPRLGPERSRWLYPIRSVMETGAIVAAGSDWSVTSMNPLLAIETAIRRVNPRLQEGEPGSEAWIPQERVELEQILRAYTMGGALAADMEAETGSITPGKLADLIVLDRDLFQVDATDISDARVELTVLEGRVVHQR
ncbi:MAG TPA: amidohydrolase [Longimicrobiales bacterium]|nr:amidohydrolase [Longimicrobiales bacterium]